MANSFEGIRYFATNRDMENLRQLRGDRVSLWSGGYFFLDMCRYVPHFMETVQERSLPEHCIVQNSDDAVFREFIAHPKVGAVAICVHGFNVALHESYFWFRTLTDTLRSAPGLRDRFVCDATEIQEIEERLKQEGKTLEDGALIACIGFSWPSDGAVLSYLSDQREAVGSASALANLVSRIHVWGRRVNLVCHSMGNHLACHMLAGLVDKKLQPKNFVDILAGEKPRRTPLQHYQLLDLIKRRGDRMPANVDANGHVVAPDGKPLWFIDRYIMLAPDIERRQVTKTTVPVTEVSDVTSNVSIPGRTASAKSVSTEIQTTQTRIVERESYVGIFHGGIEHLAGRAFNFYSRFDGALAISNVEKGPRKVVVGAKALLDKMTLGLVDWLERNPDERWEQRLGASPHPPNAPPNMVSFNATEISDREIGHSDYIDSRPLAYLVGLILTGELDGREIANWNPRLRQLLARNA
jgi:hypothetical protein